MDIKTIVRTLTPLTDAFEFYGIPYYLTDSLAISVYVKGQAAQGIEVVTDIKFSQVPALVATNHEIWPRWPSFAIFVNHTSFLSFSLLP